MNSHLLYVFIFASSVYIDVTHCDTRTLYGDRKSSYLAYPSWNISATGILRFKFKTNQANCMLIYADDHLQKRGNGNFIKIQLVDSVIEVTLQISYYLNDNILNVQTQSSRVRIGVYLNDNNYHYVEIQRNGDNTKITVDGFSKTISLKVYYLHLNSSLHVGGVPFVMRKYVDNDVIFEKRFVGCISHIRYDDLSTITSLKKKIVPLEENHSASGCQNMCPIEETSSCLHSGRCLNNYYETLCDCRGTGYKGDVCDIPTNSIYLSGYDYLTWQPDVELSEHSTIIIMRFRTAQSSGILFYAYGENVEKEYMLLELYKKSLVFHYKSKGSKAETIQLGDNEINQTYWRFVYIYRYGNSISMRLDDSRSIRRYLKSAKGNIYTDDLGYMKFTNIFIGGLALPKTLKISKSQKHFKGCLQDIYINQVNFLGMFNEGNSVGRYGNIVKGCKSYTFTEDTSFPIPFHPSLLANQSVNLETDKKDFINTIGINDIHTSTHSSAHHNNITWLVVGVCVAVSLIGASIIIIGRHIFKRKRKRLQYRSEYVKQCKHREEQRSSSFLSANQQKSIRNEVEKCAEFERRKLQTFSPDRKVFYASPDEIIPLGHRL